MFTNRRAVLHVDDDPAMCRFVAEVLEREGYDVESVTNPLDAIDALIEGQHQIVLLDIDMPDKTGMHVLTDIKAHDAGIQVIMLTGLVGLPTVLETHRLGAEACLFKPIANAQPLLDALEDAFRRVDRWWGTLRDLTKLRKAQEQSLAEPGDACPSSQQPPVAMEPATVAE